MQWPTMLHMVEERVFRVANSIIDQFSFSFGQLSNSSYWHFFFFLIFQILAVQGGSGAVRDCLNPP